jgi:hypothetical protein
MIAAPCVSTATCIPLIDSGPRFGQKIYRSGKVAREMKRAGRNSEKVLLKELPGAI